jgi:hypothetical protein
MVLLQGPTGWRFLISEVPQWVYADIKLTVLGGVDFLKLMDEYGEGNIELFFANQVLFHKSVFKVVLQKSIPTQIY